MKARRIVLDWIVIALSITAIVGLFIPLINTSTGNVTAMSFLWNLFAVGRSLPVTIAVMGIITAAADLFLLILAIDDLCFRSITVKSMSLISAIVAIGFAIVTFVLGFVYAGQILTAGIYAYPAVGIYLLAIASFVNGIIAIVGNSLSIPSHDQYRM